MGLLWSSCKPWVYVMEWVGVQYSFFLRGGLWLSCKPWDYVMEWVEWVGVQYSFFLRGGSPLAKLQALGCAGLKWAVLE